MSDSSFPFDQPAGAPVVDGGEEPGRSKAPLLLAGGLVVALGAGAYVLLGGSGSEGDAFTAAPLTGAKPAAAAPAPAEAPPALEVVPVASDEQVGRNPFKARYVAPKQAAVVTTASSATTTSGTAPGTASGTTSGGTGTTSGSGSSAGTGAASPTSLASTKSVSLVDVDDAGVATFVVTSSNDDTPTPAVVAPGEVFASYFRYINHRTSVGPDDAPRECAKVLVGDALIELCQNDSYEVKTS